VTTNQLLLIWIVLSTVGATLSAYGLFDGLQDLGALGGLANGRRLLARSFVWAEGLRLSIQAAWLVVGILAWLAAGGQSAPARLSPAILAIYWGQTALIAKSLVQLKVRAIVRRLPPPG
jgi:hypothetical protein